jgi:hypothetical protein
MQSRYRGNQQFSGGEFFDSIFKILFKDVETSWTDVPTGGRVAVAEKAWKVLTTNEWVLQTVKGCSLEFAAPSHLPKNIFVPELKLSFDHQEIIHIEVTALLQKHAIKEVTRDNLEVVCPMFIVSKSDGGHRPVHNLKPLNKFLADKHFKLAGLPGLWPLIKWDDFFIKIDLKDAYLSLAMNPNTFKFLGFPHRGKFFHWASLPFGLSQAPWIFTKILKPVEAFFRKLNICVTFYFDDILAWNSNPNLLASQGVFMCKVLMVLGFLVNIEKSILQPTREIKYLGFLVNSKSLTVSIPKEKVDVFLSELELLLQTSEISLKSLSSVIGKMSSFCTAILAGHLHFRNLEKCLHMSLKQSAGNYKTVISLDPSLKESLIWWKHNIELVNKRSFQPPRASLEIFSDSSLFRWGAICNNQMISYAWPVVDGSHINVKELRAARRAFQTFCS